MNQCQEQLSVPFFRPFISTTHLYSLAPHEKNFMGTLEAHLWPGVSALLLLQSHSVFTATSYKETFFICHQQTQNVHVESVSLTESLALDCLFPEPSLLSMASAGCQEGSRCVSFPGQRDQTNSCSTFWWFCCPILHSLYISSTKSIMTDTVCFRLLINSWPSSLLTIVLHFCFTNISTFPHLKLYTGFI